MDNNQEKSQFAKLLDVYVLGPSLIKAGKNESGFLKWGLIIAGIATTVYSAKSYKAKQEEINNEKQERTRSNAGS